MRSRLSIIFLFGFSLLKCVLSFSPSTLLSVPPIPVQRTPICDSTNATGFAPLVVGGNTTYPGEFPWIVNIRLETESDGEIVFCGGSLIDFDVVLTAAHCLYNNSNWKLTDVSKLVVVAGDYDITCDDGTEQVLKVAETRIHENFDKKSLKNDIALIKLSKSVNLNRYIKMVSLPSFDIPGYKHGTTAVVAGWGSTDSASFSPTLQKAQLQLYPKEECKIPKNGLQICAGGNGTDACTGDSGGPLMCKYGSTFYLCGIVSYGQDNKCGLRPGIYTDVFGYMKWIVENRGFEPAAWISFSAWIIIIVALTIALLLVVIVVFTVFFKRCRRRPEDDIAGSISRLLINQE